MDRPQQFPLFGSLVELTFGFQLLRPLHNLSHHIQLFAVERNEPPQSGRVRVIRRSLLEQLYGFPQVSCLGRSSLDAGDRVLAGRRHSLAEAF
jgi:hypothetical protein